MKLPLSLATGLLAAVAVSAAAAAQQPAPAPRPTPVFRPPPIGPRLADPGALPNPSRAQRLERDIWMESLNRQALAREPRERLDRAVRVGALIDQGLCGPAAQLARSEHDDAMAERVPIACAAHRQQRRS